MNTIWKISCKVQCPPIKQLEEKNGSIITNVKKIGDTLTETIQLHTTHRQKIRQKYSREQNYH